MTTENIKDTLGGVLSVAGIGAIVWILIWTFSIIGDAMAKADQEKEAWYQANKAQVMSFDAQLEAKKKCADAGLSVNEDKIQTGWSDWEVSGVTCGKPFAQVQAEALDQGMTTGEGVAAGAALGAGAYILGKMME